MASLYLFVLFFLVVLCVGVFGESYDVCVLGGGASGAASAVFLKDLGYSVKVIEKNGTLGGHCNTVHYNLNGQQAFIDIGVQAYINTTFCNEQGFGSWAIDSVRFVTKFAPSIIPIGGASSGASPVSYNANFLTGQVLNLGALNVTDFQIALGTLSAFVAQYPWLNTGERPDPIPAVLLQPFSQFIKDNHLEVLIFTIFNNALFGGGSPPIEQLSTLQALLYMGSAALALFTGTAGSGFVINGGCQTLYDGIASYLGSGAITYSATITDVDRDDDEPAIVKGYSLQSGVKTHFRYECGKLIVSFPPLLHNLLPWFDLTFEELILFSQLQAQAYLALATTFTEGPLVAGQAFSINNVNPARPWAFNLPAEPNLSIFNRNLPFGPAAAWVNAPSSLIPAEVLLGIAELQFQGVSSQLLSNISILAWSLHEYGPHWNNFAQGLSPSPDTLFRKLQGEQNTFWVGATLTLEGSHVVWNHAYKLIHENFPPKTH